MNHHKQRRKENIIYILHTTLENTLTKENLQMQNKLIKLVLIPLVIG